MNVPVQFSAFFSSSVFPETSFPSARSLTVTESFAGPSHFLVTLTLVFSVFLFVIVYYKADWYNVVPYRSVIIDWLIGKEL